MNTSELTGELLNYWTAKAVGFSIEPYLDGRRLRDSKGCACAHIGITSHTFLPRYSPSTDWSQGGPIQEKHEISVGYYEFHGDGPMKPATDKWWQSYYWKPPMKDPIRCKGATPLQVICRTCVSIQYGDEVPDEK